MSGVFQVDTDSIQAASAETTRIASDIETQVRVMMSKLEALQGAWRGTAASNFASVSQDWRATQDQVRASLERISQALAQAGQQYAAAEQANAAMFG